MFLDEVCDILDLLYKHNWDERNGGNLSYILNEEEVSEICDINNIIRTFTYDFDMSEIVGRYFIITGTGSYFKNMKKDPEANLGILKVIDKNTLALVWGYNKGGRPTSEAPTHLKCHIERLKKDPNQRVIIHSHPTNVVCLTHVAPIDSNFITEKLWKMQTESIVVFPEGVGILPWILCGGNLIGEKTAELMKEYRACIWAQHGIFCAGTNLDEVFGLIETIEKASEIYLKVMDKKIYQSITNENLKEIAEAFKLDYKKGIID